MKPPSRFSVLRELIAKHQWKRGVELGVWQGALFGYLLETFPDLELVGVDHWRPIGPYATKDMAAAEAEARKLLAKHSQRAQFVRCDTARAAEGCPDASFDFVFIDASHDRESVIRDVQAWRSKVRPGGRLLGHDANLASVRDALDATLPGWQRLPANCWIGPAL